MKVKVILSALLAVSLVAAAGCSSGGLAGVHNPVPDRAQTTSSESSSQSETQTTDYADIARIWLDNEDIWSNTDDMPAGGIAGIYNTGYYIFDIDLDGEKELLVQLGGDQTQSCKTLIYKLTDGEIQQINTADNLNLAIQNLSLWANDEGDKFYINEHTLIDENGVFITSWSKIKFIDGIISEEPAFYLRLTQDKLTGNMDTMIYYMADNETAISDEDFIAQYDAYLDGYTEILIEPVIIKSTSWQYYTRNQKLTAIQDELKKSLPVR